MSAFDKLNRFGEAIARVYAEITDRIIVNLARFFKELKPGEQPGGAFEYQAKKLAELGQVTAETTELIAQRAGMVSSTLRRSLERSIMTSLDDLEPQLREAAKRGLLTDSATAGIRGAGDQEIAPTSPRMTRAFRLYADQATDKLNLVNTVMLESTEEAYRATVSDIVGRMRRTQQILNTAAGEVITGAESFNQAQRLAVEQMVENGITGFVDHGGHRWRPETYVAMDMRSTMHNVSRDAFWEVNDRFGNDVFLVSQHPGSGAALVILRMPTSAVSPLAKPTVPSGTVALRPLCYPRCRVGQSSIANVGIFAPLGQKRQSPRDCRLGSVR